MDRARVLAMVLMGCLVAECLLLFTGSNRKYFDVIQRVLDKYVTLNKSIPSFFHLVPVSKRHIFSDLTWNSNLNGPPPAPPWNNLNFLSGIVVLTVTF